jgi:uncharacterized membrane protein
MVTSTRSPAIDWMRGLVMVLMALDHSSGEFNAGRLFADGTFLYQPGSPLPTAQFLTRWVTHLCAPTFVFLTGTALALSIDRRQGSGEPASSIDRHLLVRGALIVAFEGWVSLFWMPPGRYLLQVLYAIGTSMILMIPLRRLPAPALAALAVAEIAFGEAVGRALGWGPPSTTPVAASFLLVAGPRGPFIVAYPTLPWLAMMVLGWVFGRIMIRRADPLDLARGLAAFGAALLGLFAVIRGYNRYGNMGLLREGGSLVQWLHVSKYPPSVTFVALELGIMSFVLAAFFLAGRRLAERGVAPNPNGVLLVFGRTPMFFYLLHIPFLSLLAKGLGMEHALGLGGTYAFAAVVVACLYPLCRWYGRYKAAHPNGWARYV